MIPSSCPNCGAPVSGPECEYCGTLFDEGGGYTLYDAFDDVQLFRDFSGKAVAVVRNDALETAEEDGPCRTS